VDHPRKAKWLNEAEKTLLIKRLEEEEHLKRLDGLEHHRLVDAFRSWRVWVLCLVYFGMTSGNYAVQFWLPQILKDTITKDPFRIGLLTMIPSAIGAVAMVLIGHHSDKTGERRWHVSLTVLLAGVGLGAASIPGVTGVTGFAALTIAAAAVISASSTFWSLPTAYLSGAAASAGIAWINSVGNLGGFVSPFLVGAIRDLTHSTSLALFVVACGCFGSAILVATLFKKRFAVIT
jgi:nitrate/nitrite transporter NarK